MQPEQHRAGSKYWAPAYATFEEELHKIHCEFGSSFQNGGLVEEISALG